MKSVNKVNVATQSRVEMNGLGLWLCALALSLFSFLPAQAQVEQGNVRASLGLAYGTKSAMSSSGESTGGIGLTPALEYIFLQSTGANLSYDFFFKSKDFQLTSLNIDLRRYFTGGNTQLYGLAGVAFTTVKVDVGGGIKASESETVFNLGLGAVFQLADNLGVNAQVKYVTKIKQVAINAGWVYSF